MSHVFRMAAVLLAGAAPFPLAAQDVAAPVPVSTVSAEALAGLPGTPVARLLETTYAGVAVLDPATNLVATARGNYFLNDKFAIAGSATAAHLDLGIDDLTQVEALIGAQYLQPFGGRASAGVLAMIGFQDSDFGGDAIYNLAAVTRYSVFPAAALYTGLYYKSAFGGGHQWSIESQLMPGKFPGLPGYFAPRRGLWEVNFSGQYQIDPGDFLNLGARAAPFLTDRFQVGADLGWSREDAGFDTFTQTSIEGFGAYHFPMDGRLLPYVGAFGGYQSATGSDGAGSFGGRAGVKLSCTPTSSVYLEGEYRTFTGDFADNQFGFRVGTNIYAGF